MSNNTMKTLSNQVLALAGVYLACDQVKRIAWKGQSDPTLLDIALLSIFKTDSKDVQDIYNHSEYLQPGLKLLSDDLTPHAEQHDLELTRYTLGLLSLQRKLTKRHDLLSEISSAIANSNTQLQHYGTNHPNTWAALAAIYQNTVSRLTPKIMINGERTHLANEDNAAKIRALLLAGIRSAVLWRQCGGSRLAFMLNRRNYLHEANALLNL